MASYVGIVAGATSVGRFRSPRGGGSGSPSTVEPEPAAGLEAVTRFLFGKMKKWLCRSHFLGVEPPLLRPRRTEPIDRHRSVHERVQTLPSHFDISFCGVRDMPVVSDRVLMKELSEAKPELKGDVSYKNTQLYDNSGSNLQF